MSAKLVASTKEYGRSSCRRRHSDPVDEEQGIYRGEVLAVMVALASIHANTRAIVTMLGGDEDDDEAEEMDS